MTDWSEELGFILRKIGKSAKWTARVVGSAFDDDPHEIVGYRGYGNASRAWVYGRVIERRDFGAAADTDSTLVNLLNTYRRADSDPLPFARVEVAYSDSRLTVTADDEGFFGGWIDLAREPAQDVEWGTFTAALTSPGDAGRPIEGTGEVLHVPTSARMGIISDIDDTVIQSRVSSFLQAARTVMLGNARTRLPFPGVAAFYRSLRDGASGGEANPVFYVSSSPWNIHDVIAEFMDLQHIPKGPILLRDWDINVAALSSSRHFDHKGVAIRNILDLYPSLPFILVGDSSQHDPEIYRQIVNEYPGRINAVYIRDVTRDVERSASVRKLADEILASSSILVLAEDTLGAATHAVERGWIKEESLPDIGDEKKADQGTEGNKVATPDGGKPGTRAVPTVVERS